MVARGCDAGPGGPRIRLRSFWMAGYEGADHVNGEGRTVAPNHANGHIAQCAEDYALLAPFGIRTIRESVGWRTVANEGTGALLTRARAAHGAGLQVIWSVMHYGWPDGVDLFSERFAAEFARFCGRVARLLAPYHDDPPVYSPVNEISFLAWAIAATRLIHPFDGSLAAQGFDIKRRLVRAAIAGADAIRDADPRARILHVDPVLHIVAPRERPDLAEHAASLRSHQFQAWDMLAGRLEPQLGGSAAHLDLVGVNWYHANQWTCEYADTPARTLFWHARDPRRLPFRSLLAEVHERYRRPLIVGETSHVGSGRADWIAEIADEVAAAIAAGVPVEGVCLYPILDRCDWNDPAHWHRCGLWDVHPVHPAGHRLERRLHAPSAAALHAAQARLRIVTRGGMHLLPSTGPDPMMPTLLVFSHLRWDFVYQRPQQLLTRLAADHRVIYVEEPVHDDAADFIERMTPSPNVEVWRPHTSIRSPGFHDDQLPALTLLLGRTLADAGAATASADGGCIVWLYTPMALPLATALGAGPIVYDCMDELSAFKFAPRQIVQRENALLKAAAAVFTGGQSLYRAKRDRNANVHCLPSSVDAAHFERAATLTDHPAQAALARPRLGYYGVIDERIDYALIDALAGTHPDWEIVMVGPVVKVDPATLPKHPNLHWLGQRPYAELPAFLAGWDVALLPFALNDATRYISPTKTLEYMAAGRPIVGTPIADVAGPYGHIVRIAADPAAFAAACAAALAETPGERAARSAAVDAVLARTSWDATVERIREVLRPLTRRTGDAPAARPVVVLGAGPTGLAAAFHLGERSVLLEREPTVGGWCRSIEDGGFTFDFAGHIMFSNDPYVLDLYKKLLRDNVHWQDREAWIYSKNVYTRYPFQGSLYGLPPKVLKECLVGAIEARFGPLKPAGEPHPGATELRASAPRRPEPPRSFREFIDRVWGRGVARHFATPYNEKLWAVPLEEMETSWLGGRVPLPDLEEMIEGALEPKPKPMGPNARFGYPLRGGFQALMNGFLPHLRGRVETNANVVAVSPSAHTVRLADGRTFGYERLISTLALPALVRAIGAEAPEAVRAAARALRHVSVRCVNLGIGRPALTEKHWIYYPEDTVFHRIFVQGNASPECNPPGGFGLTCEITYSPQKPLPSDGRALIDRVIADCVKVGIIRADDPVWVANQVDLPIAYVVYDHQRKANVEIIRAWLARHDILLAGRYSEWEYYNSDHAFVAGRNAARQALERPAGSAALEELTA